MLPKRMCAVCRERREKAELFRVVKSADGKVCVDLKGDMPGRGAYVCRNGTCVDAAARRRALERAFSCAVDKDIYETLERLSENSDD